MKMLMFGKKADGKARYWLSISDTVKQGNEEGQISASVNVRLSRKAEETFAMLCEETRTAGIVKVYADATDFWFKAGRTADGKTFPIVFVNEMQKAEKKQEGKAKW